MLWEAWRPGLGVSVQTLEEVAATSEKIRMDTNILTPMTLFLLPVRYTIPEFQRRYVWNQDEQWEPLWDDVRNAAETYLEEFDRSGGNSVLAAQNMPNHFFGAVVLQDGAWR